MKQKGISINNSVLKNMKIFDTVKLFAPEMQA